jgi:hypothetical protein
LYYFAIGGIPKKQLFPCLELQSLCGYMYQIISSFRHPTSFPSCPFNDETVTTVLPFLFESLKQS